MCVILASQYLGAVTTMIYHTIIVSGNTRNHQSFSTNQMVQLLSVIIALHVFCAMSSLDTGTMGHDHNHHDHDIDHPHDPSCNDPTHNHDHANVHDDHSHVHHIDDHHDHHDAHTAHAHDHHDHGDGHHDHSAHDHAHSHDHNGHYHHPLNSKAHYVPPEQRNDGVTPLMSFILRNEDKKALELVKEGVDMNAQNKDGVTALMFALGKRQYEVARALITQGADVTLASKDGLTALMVAVGQGTNDTEIIKLLMSKGADIVELAKTYPKATAYVRHHPDLLEYAKEVSAASKTDSTTPRQPDGTLERDL